MLHSRAAVTARAGLPVAGPPAGCADSPPATSREATDAKPPPHPRYLWAMLLARIDEVFPLLCPRCGQPMRIIAFVTDSGSITLILAYLGEPTQAPRIAPAARVPPWEKDFEPRQGTDLSEPLPDFEFDQRVSW